MSQPRRPHAEECLADLVRDVDRRRSTFLVPPRTAQMGMSGYYGSFELGALTSR